MLTRKDIINSPFDVRDFIIKAEKNVPKKYSCSDKVPIKDQGMQSTCVAHALASLVEYHYKVQYQEYKAFSTEFIYGNREEGDYVGDGMVMRQALKNLQKYGDCYLTDCRGNNGYKTAIAKVAKNRDKYLELAYPHHISAYYRCDGDNEIKTAIFKHGPVIASMNTYKDAKIKDDIYTTKEEIDSDTGRHCIMIYGYDERGWLVQNSWGLMYGGDGRFVIPYDFCLNEVWGVTDDIYDPNIKKTNRNVVLDWFYKLFNELVNWWIDFTNRT